jgi:hypothetical protein
MIVVPDQVRWGWFTVTWNRESALPDGSGTGGAVSSGVSGNIAAGGADAGVQESAANEQRIKTTENRYFILSSIYARLFPKAS